MSKVGRGSGSVNVDDLQAILIYSNKSAQNFIMILLWSDIFNNWNWQIFRQPPIIFVLFPNGGNTYKCLTRGKCYCLIFKNYVFNISYYFFSNQEKDDGLCLKMKDQIIKFLFKTIWNTVTKFPVTRAPVFTQFRVLKMLLILYPALIGRNVVTNVLPDFSY